MLSTSQKKTEQFFFFFLFFSFLIGTSVVYIFNFNGPPIRSDGVGYYSYLPSTFIYHDLTMKSFVDVYSAKTQHKISPKDLGLIANHDSTVYLNKYPLGTSIMMIPYFLLGHGASLITHQFIPTIKADGITSPFYHFFIAFGSSLYILLGLLILKKILDQYFSIKAVYTTLILLIFATNLFHYSTYDSVFSHAYSLFLFAAFIRLTQLWYLQPALKLTLLLSIIGAMILLVRPTNGLVFIFFLLYRIQFSHLKSFLKQRLLWYKKYINYFLLLIIIGFVILIPQFLYWKFATGSWFVFSYKDEGFNFLHPKVWSVLFSVKKGLFFWAPILFLIIPGIFIMRKRLELLQWVFPLTVYFGSTIYLIASWWWWSYGGSYGHRGFIESFVVLAIPLAAFFDYLFKKATKGLQVAVLTFSSICILLCMFMMLQYWRGYLPFDGTTWDIYLSALRNIDIVNR